MKAAYSPLMVSSICSHEIAVLAGLLDMICLLPTGRTIYRCFMGGHGTVAFKNPKPLQQQKVRPGYAS